MSLYRSVVWFAKGLREYTKSGYESACKDFVPHDLEVQIPGRVFLVTGGNSGIGKATALEIAKRGGTVHLVCRDQAPAEDARGEIIRESGNQNIFLHIVDLSDPKQIWKFVENFKQEHKLHVLINNAGCMVNKRELTEDGLEKNFAANTLGVYILTTGLIPVLEKEHDPRVQKGLGSCSSVQGLGMRSVSWSIQITVSSGGMLVQKLNTNDLQSERTPFDGTMVYAQNKRQQVVLTERWAQGHPAIHFSSMHPGWADTPDRNEQELRKVVGEAQTASPLPRFLEIMMHEGKCQPQGHSSNDLEACWSSGGGEQNSLPDWPHQLHDLRQLTWALCSSFLLYKQGN
ncbi:dehydrogenase/reductase SDR family member 12 isoform X4 [Homo sapiens]|uniref:dehydrogenase/reductase SDR family member 12 isoform X4 n=1 Tax=Homo sapiens TaxID=9606 RepID=UPI001FB118B2|nr:dehydrogenase/reductase SDR family member 12 isoform X4 [Homo sapiens]